MSKELQAFPSPQPPPVWQLLVIPWILILWEESKAAPGALLGRPGSEQLYTLGRNSSSSLSSSSRVKVRCWLKIKSWPTKDLHPGLLLFESQLTLTVFLDRSSRLKTCDNKAVHSLSALLSLFSWSTWGDPPSDSQWITYLDSISNIPAVKETGCEYPVPHFMHQNSFIPHPTLSVNLKTHSCWKVRGGPKSLFWDSQIFEDRKG